ncbi:MAG: hypothetical protein J7L82_04015 [Staphylothermus sp.]|nr:hypothetical protein [Staphylothermus sp.]
MFTITIQLTSINAEKLSETLPPKIQFGVNLAIPSGNPFRRNNQLVVPFTFTVSTIPPVAQIVLKGNAVVISNDKKELEKMEKNIREKKMPQPLLQAVFTNMLAESVILSRSLGVPPPLPGMPQLQSQQGKQSGEKHKFTPNTVI